MTNPSRLPGCLGKRASPAYINSLLVQGYPNSVFSLSIFSYLRWKFVRSLNDHHLLIILNNLNDLRIINIDYTHSLEGLRTELRDEITRSNLNYRVKPIVIIEDEEEDNEKMRNKDEKTKLKDYDLKYAYRIVIYFQPIVSIPFRVHA